MSVPPRLSADRCAVITPLLAADGAECRRLVAEVGEWGDWVEWRVDQLAVLRATPIAHLDERMRATVRAVAREVAALGRPILATVRSRGEGGEVSFAQVLRGGDGAEAAGELPLPLTAGPANRADPYVELISLLASLPGVCAVDVEYTHPRRVEAQAAVLRAGRGVVSSRHFFAPEVASGLTVDDLVSLLGELQSAPPPTTLAPTLSPSSPRSDIVAKLALACSDSARCEQISAAARRYRALTGGHAPFILIAMGEAGRPTRLGAAALGCAATFACAETSGGSLLASAPGQVGVRETRAALCDPRL